MLLYFVSFLQVWYDDGYKMIRYDPHYGRAVYPYYTTHPLSVVEDYNTGKCCLK